MAPGESPGTVPASASVKSSGITAITTWGAAGAGAGTLADAPAGPRTSPASASIARAMEPIRTFVKFTFFKLDPEWHRRDPELRAEDKREFLAACEDYATDRSLRAYSTVGTRGDTDLLLLA